FLGLCIWKFGNPVILDHNITAPATLADCLSNAWPIRWANWILLPLATWGAWLVLQSKISWPQSKWLLLLPLGWLGWQFVSATQTVDSDLTAATLWQFFGCVACYFIGALVIGTPSTASARTGSPRRAGAAPGAPRSQNAFSFLLIGILAAFAFCLVRVVEQRLVEFPQTHQMLVEGARDGWTNVPPEMLLDMKREQVVITTNGVDVANPVVLKKFASGRVMGTLVYPNALAGAVLLLLPAALTLAFGAKQLRPAIRAVVIALTCFLGGAGFFWTGSKLGWLIA